MRGATGNFPRRRRRGSAGRARRAGRRVGRAGPGRRYPARSHRCEAGSAPPKAPGSSAPAARAAQRRRGRAGGVAGLGGLLAPGAARLGIAASGAPPGESRRCPRPLGVSARSRRCPAGSWHRTGRPGPVSRGSPRPNRARAPPLGAERSRPSSSRWFAGCDAGRAASPVSLSGRCHRASLGDSRAVFISIGIFPACRALPAALDTSPFLPAAPVADGLFPLLLLCSGGS